MVFKNQHTNTLDAGIGWSFYFKKPITSKNTFIMNANVLANKQFLDNERNIHFHLQSIINSHGAVPTRIPTDYYTSVNVSMAYLFAGFMSASLGYNGYFGKDRYKNNVITLSVGICCF